MKAVSAILLTTILELQRLPSLTESTLGGGTNLAIRYGHRESHDIDLFFPGIIGKTGYEVILKEISDLYKDKPFLAEYPCDEDDQFLFQRIIIKKRNTPVKIEILQNFHTYDEPEFIQGIRLMSEQDIALLKLITACNRANDKDIYDLDYLTDHLPLGFLMIQLKEKQVKFAALQHQNIFDLDGTKSPVDNPELLLKFENPVKSERSRPGHSNPRIDHLNESKNWALARSSWRRKVRAYFSEIGRDFPEAIDYSNDNVDGV